MREHHILTAEATQLNPKRSLSTVHVHLNLPLEVARTLRQWACPWAPHRHSGRRADCQGAGPQERGERIRRRWGWSRPHTRQPPTTLLPG